MKNRPSRHIVALVSMLVLLLSGQAGVQGYVWCLGQDGHSALEYAARDKCGPITQQQDRDCHGEEVFELPSREEHCGPCSDLPASFDVTSRRNLDQDDFALEAGLSATAQVAPISAFVRVLTANLYPNPPPRISQTILSHRTVVILN